MKIKLSRMERLAVTGLHYRYHNEVNEAIARRNADLLAVLEEHGHHQVPDEFRLASEAGDGYIDTIAWNEESEETHA